jgi:hypothetical protein
MIIVIAVIALINAISALINALINALVIVAADFDFVYITVGVRDCCEPC